MLGLLRTYVDLGEGQMAQAWRLKWIELLQSLISRKEFFEGGALHTGIDFDQVVISEASWRGMSDLNEAIFSVVEQMVQA